MQYGEIIDVSHDSMRGEWRFDLMIDHKTFYSIPNWLDLDGRKLPIIVIGRKPMCWRCGLIGHLSAKCPGKKAPSTAPDHIRNPLSPSTAKEKKEAPAVSPTVRTTVPAPVGESHSSPPSPSTPSVTPTEESKGKWLTVGKGGRMTQPAVPQSPKVSRADTDKKGETPRSYAAQSKIRCSSPGKEKFEKLLEWKKKFDEARKSAPPPGCSRSSRSSPPSPRQRTLKPPLTPPARTMPPPKLTVLGPKKNPLPLKKKTTTPVCSPLKSPAPSPSPTPMILQTPPSTAASKRQRSPSVGSSEDELPKHKRKDRAFRGGYTYL